MSEKKDERTISYKYLKEQVELQKKVRRCEEEGMVWGIEEHLRVFQLWNLISFSEWEELIAILNND